jgi:surfeit locus 1 family protein
LLAAYAAGQEQRVRLTAANAGTLPRYQRVTVSGRYETGRQFLLDNMPSKDGKPGYRVLTPLRLDDGTGLVLVDRGWIPMGPDRFRLPDVGVGDGHRDITGTLDVLPQPGVRLGEAGTASDGWPKVVNFPRHEELVAMYGGALLQPLLLLDPAADGGYERAWEARFGFGPERHVGYAIQWFSLSAALIVLYVVMGMKAGRRLVERNK